ILIAGCKGVSKRSTDSERSTPPVLGPPTGSPPSSSPSPSPSSIDARATRPGESCPPQARTRRHEVPGRLIAIGDLHGDLGAMRRALRLSGAIDETDQWIGGDLVIVQTGDILDRGDDEQEILDLFARLGEQALAAGGAIHRLN